MANKKIPNKILQKTARRSNGGLGLKPSKEKSQVMMMKDQYEIIREDLMKLRDDIAKGYDMAKDLLDKKSLRGILKTK